MSGLVGEVSVVVWLSESEIVGSILQGGDLGPVDPELRVGFVAAARGLSPVVPAYRVTTDQDGRFVMVVEGPLRDLQVAAVRGDVQHRFVAGLAARGGGDPFAGVRHVPFVGRWPGDVDRQPRTFPCLVCGGVSVHPGDVGSRYCVRCHRATGDPEDATPGSPLARAVESGVVVVELPGLDSSGVVFGVEADGFPGRWVAGRRAGGRPIEDVSGVAMEQPVIPGETS